MKAVVGEEALSSEDLVSLFLSPPFCRNYVFVFSHLSLAIISHRLKSQSINLGLGCLKFSFIWSSQTNSRGNLWLKGLMIPATSSSHQIWHGHYSASSPVSFSTVYLQRHWTSTTVVMQQTDKKGKPLYALFSSQIQHELPSQYFAWAAGLSSQVQ